MSRLFTPPGRVVRRGKHPLFGRLSLTQGVTLLKGHDGLYRQVENPSDEAIAGAAIAYLGGREYRISDVEAASLTAAGYGQWIVSPPTAGYGVGGYGEGAYGGDPVLSGYGYGPYGSGEFGGA